MAAPEFTLFVKPYLEGYINGEEGNTPVTAEILNENYDAFLLALNEWATSVGLILESAVTDSNYVHTDNNYTTTEKNKLSGVEDNANNYSLPTASTSTLGGVKVDGITITIANGVISAVGGGGTDVEGNPSGTPTAVLSSIRIGNDIFSIPGGGGGGSSVSFSQILATGTKIGTITIDGVPTDIYAPAPPTKTSDLNNDSNFVSDASYVHTDNNYTTTEKNKLADLNQVEANPSSGTSAGDLTSISIDGTKYNIPSGGSSPEITGANYFEVEGTLTAGSTTITLSDSNITANSMIDIWTNVANLNYTDMSISNGSVTVTFPAQQSNVSVIARVWGAITGYDYSTTEHKTGRKWIDGRDIYECTVNTGALTQYQTYVNLSLNIDMMISMNGLCYNNDEWYSVPWFVGNFDYMITLMWDKSNNRLRIEKGSALSSMDYSYVTLEYVKPVS